MPYPFEKPKAKHDFLCPPPTSGTLADACGFSSSGEIFQALSENVRSDLNPLAAVYSYPDAPPIPLSRGLMVIGVADVSLSVVRKLVEDDDEIPDCLHKCTIAVKRADAGQALPSKDVKNSTAFANFLRKLRNEGLVAILGQDKHSRFGILKPTEDMTTEGDFEGQDFAAVVFVGQVEEVKTYLTRGIRPRTPPVEEPSASADGVWDPAGGGDNGNTGGDDGAWKPPSAGDDNDGAWKPPSGGDDNAGLWKPPSADDDNAGAGLWKPPTDDTDGAAGFSWQPPSDGAAAGTEEESFDFSANANTWQANNDTNDNGKRPRDENDDHQENGDGFHADKGAAAADAFYSNLTRTLDSRANSRIYHMRAFNGWVKATQIQELDPKTKQKGKKMGKEPMRVLDLACGKGGDLGKWVLHGRGLSNYVGIDVARGSLKDAAIRARQMRQKLGRCTFTCADLGADVPGRLKSAKHKHMQKLLTWSLQTEPRGTTSDPEFRNMRGGGVTLQDRFDVVSIQFAIHYMMQTRARARRFFRTVSELLEIGGNLIATTIDARVVISHMMNLGLDLHFDGDDASEHPGALISTGGGACKLRFEKDVVRRIFHGSKQDGVMDDESLFGLEYSFTLVEGKDHAAGVGDAVNLPEWLIPIPVLKSLGEEVGLELEYAQNFHEFFDIRKDSSVHGAAHNSIYSMKVLNRHGSLSKEEWEISRMYCAIKFRKVREPSGVFEDNEEEAGDDDDDDGEIDPKVKAKLLPMAMIKAKKAAGADVWKTLPSEEKTRLTDIEVRKLAK